jgi:SAM-dependent methyltransferase
MLRSWLAHPLTKGLDIDDPQTTILRRKIIQENLFLRQIYEQWYRLIVANLPAMDGPVLELGSGAGFFKDFYAGNVISSEVFYCPTVQVVLNGQRLPFRHHSLRAIVMTDVLHHIPQVRQFFSEACRCLLPGGAIVMIEPWVSRWSSWVYSRLHAEPFLPEAKDWGFPEAGPLSAANGALPWMLFERDRQQFEREFDQLSIHSIQLLMPFRYLVSGGVSMRALMPACSFEAWQRFEALFDARMSKWAMFACITLRQGKNIVP